MWVAAIFCQLDCSLTEPLCTDGVGNGIALDSEEHAMAKKIACRTGGVYRGVKDDEDAALAIRMYYEGLAKSFRRDETVWSEPYLDSMGIGLVTTAARVRSTYYGLCMPCFVR